MGYVFILLLFVALILVFYGTDKVVTKIFKPKFDSKDVQTLESIRKKVQIFHYIWLFTILVLTIVLLLVIENSRFVSPILILIQQIISNILQNVTITIDKVINEKTTAS